AGDSTKAWTVLGSLGATASAMRPYGFARKPLLACGVISVQLLPPSALRYRPPPENAVGPSPPERNVQPLRRKSHRLANSTSGARGSRAMLPQPVDRLAPFSMSCQVPPPSVVL